MYKISPHYVGKSEIFDKMHTSCEMKPLADLVNAHLVAEIEDLMTKHDISLPGGRVLDMGIYSKDRPMSVIETGKELGEGVETRAHQGVYHDPALHGECVVLQATG